MITFRRADHTFAILFSNNLYLFFLLVFFIKVWELSDIDRDGMLERDEFAVVGNSSH